MTPPVRWWRSMARNEPFRVPVVGRLQVKLVLEAIAPHLHGVADLSNLLGECLIALDAEGRERLAKQLEGTGHEAAIARALEAAPSLGPSDPAPTTPEEVATAWAQAWKLFTKVVASSNADAGPYLRHAISYTTPDLDVGGVFADLDEAAAALLPLVEPAIVTGLSARFDFPRELLLLLSSVGTKLPWAIRPEDPMPLGPRLTQALLDWMRHDAQQRGAGAAALKTAVQTFAEETLPTRRGAELDEGTLGAFLAGRSAPEAGARPTRGRSRRR